jgi:hypothetical protein
MTDDSVPSPILSYKECVPMSTRCVIIGARQKRSRAGVCTTKFYVYSSNTYSWFVVIEPIRLFVVYLDRIEETRRNTGHVKKMNKKTVSLSDSHRTDCLCNASHSYDDCRPAALFVPPTAPPSLT